MRFRSKLFILWTATVFLPLLAMMWPLERTLRSSFERIARGGFAGTGESLTSLQDERVARMRQAGALLMSIPELRALIAEQNFEVSPENLSSLQERIDSLQPLVDVSFICVIDGHGAVIAQNRSSPWATLGQLRQFIGESPQARAMAGRIFAGVSSGAADAADAGKGEHGLWVYGRRIYQVVGMPLIFGAPAAGQPAQIDGALLMAIPLSDAIAAKLGMSHDCKVTFLAEGRPVASNLPDQQRALLSNLPSRGKWPTDGAFSLKLGDDTYLSVVEPLIDASSNTPVGAMLIQSDTGPTAAVQHSVMRSVVVIMVAALLAALVTSFVLSGAVTRPVRQMVQAARRVAGGDLTVALRTRRRDELGQLANAFDDMVHGLRRQRELTAMVEESRAANKAKGQFLANMSHEIRTPLHGVIGMAELLLRTPLAEQQRRYVGLVKSSAEVLMTLINDILDFSKIEAGKLDLESMEFDLATLVEDVVELMAQKAFPKGLKIDCYVNPALPRVVTGNPTRVRQILLNLVSNAVKFTEAGSIRIDVSPAPDAQGASLVRFDVRDTGIGIPPDRLDRLFRSFSQVDASTTRKYGGTGLGLAICKQLAELMGGQIGVDSKLGAGSTFWFTARFTPIARALDPNRNDATLPTAPTTGEPAQSEISDFKSQIPSSLLPTAGGTPLRILLAEDQEINQIVAHEVLTQAGFALEIVADGRRAWEAARTRPFDLILMDCQMPDMDGFSATRAIRQHERETSSGGPPRRVPIIALTANASGADRQRCLDAGMDDYCGKPFSSRQLLSAIAGALARSVQSVPEVPSPREDSASVPSTSQPASNDATAHDPALGSTSEPASGAPDPVLQSAAAPAAAVREPEMPPADSEPPFDTAAVLDRCSGKAHLAATILEKFSTQATSAVQQLQESLAARDGARIASVCHAIKGTAGLISAGSLRTIAARLEEIARGGGLEGAQESLEQLQGEVERCVAYVATARSRMKPSTEPLRDVATATANTSSQPQQEGVL